MKNSLKQEFYKFRHQRIPLYGAVALVVLMLYAAVSSTGVNRMIIAQGFGAGQWITIIMITVASTFVAMEYQNRTIMTLFYKSSNKSAIYFAKLIVMLIYGVLMLIFGMFLTVILKAVMVGGKYRWGEPYGQHRLWIDLLLNTTGTLIYLIFIIAVAFLLIVLIRVNAAVVGIGLVIIFMGADFSSLVMSALPHFGAIIKWNPLNMVFVINQLANSSYEKFSNLSLPQIITGNLIYAVIFIAIGDALFKSRRV
ncbi:membrane protein [Lentilactobacillus fungorum]|uniref:Membrane protein n=1 Tax=Lentilactobacillus fungorum TaxID=2201250 RepID=A0ABQ3VYY0_9LACO|nr:ABC transporter permease [Lentilactobacillus fungorum]GHP13211.1 membrane protein [Lentilactobacillus fungorum]